jgi:murein DD-endopeptidase MepM/ murein hydrolase activator NlpD
MISLRKLLIGIVVVAGVLISAAVVLYVFNFRIYFEVRREPNLNSGVAVCQTEQQSIELMYRERLDKLQGILDATAQDIRQLQVLKNRFMEIATPAPIREKIRSNEYEKNFSSLPSSHSSIDSNRPLTNSYRDAVQEITKFQKEVSNLSADWNQQLKWLQTLPTGIPISGDFRVTHGFGMLRSRSTGKTVPHEGLDFEVKTTTSVVAAASGTVKRISREKYYGYFIEITHAEGFMTRYARVRNISVEEGHVVERGQHIAQVGGNDMPHEHLHYEVYRHSRVINPVQVLPMGHD